MRSSKKVRSNTCALRTVSKRTAVTAGPASICSDIESARGYVAQRRATTCGSRLGTAPSRPCRCGQVPARTRPRPGTGGHRAALPCLDVLCARQLQDRVAEQLPRGIRGVHLNGACCVRRWGTVGDAGGDRPSAMLFATARCTLQAACRTVRCARWLLRDVRCLLSVMLCVAVQFALDERPRMQSAAPEKKGCAPSRRLCAAATAPPADAPATHSNTLQQRTTCAASTAPGSERARPPAPRCARANAKCPLLELAAPLSAAAAADGGGHVGPRLFSFVLLFAWMT